MSINTFSNATSRTIQLRSFVLEEDEEDKFIESLKSETFRCSIGFCKERTIAIIENTKRNTTFIINLYLITFFRLLFRKFSKLSRLNAYLESTNYPQCLDSFKDKASKLNALYYEEAHLLYENENIMLIMFNIWTGVNNQL